MSYREELGVVLKNLSFKIGDGEKVVGVVGRTGSGKSSLTVGLWRICEPLEGCIFIGGQNTSELNLVQLRENLSIIPQNATLFNGTIRYNLDPFETRNDSEIWEALRKCHMKEVIEGMKKGLGTKVREGGQNFSVGKAIVMFGKDIASLLRDTKIFVFDEATASVDVNTEKKIQETIQECFGEKTCLTIAHRLETIIDSDKILVMHDGRVAEFDTPKNLLKDEKYHRFRDLLQESENSEFLVESICRD